MSGELKVNYEAVYSKTRELRQRLQSELREAQTTYRQAHTDLRRLDSSTNAELVEAMQINQQKANLTAETLTKLLAFIEASTRQVERDESHMTRSFSRSRIRQRRR